MVNMQVWLYNNLQKWTPFSAIVLLAAAFCIFTGVWDVIHGVNIPVYIWTLFSFILGGTGATTLINHGVTVANGVASSTAHAVVQEVIRSGPLPPAASDGGNTHV